MKRFGLLLVILTCLLAGHVLAVNVAVAWTPPVIDMQKWNIAGTNTIVYDTVYKKVYVGTWYDWQRKNLLVFDVAPDGKWAVKQKVKEEVIFRSFNLMEESLPFRKKFHVIFCRNVMIYFDYKTKSRLVERFYDATEEGGYLFIGHAESLSHDETKYQYVIPAVYRKV
jgi:chemotaxis methyl-accepting protein methylase